MFREYYDSHECLKLVGIFKNFELSDLVGYRTLDWWFFSALAFDVDVNKITRIIETKIIDEEKNLINSVIISEFDESDPKRI
ncbi:hypothetical protein [Dickeya fangzhongdai]|uniref:hypothetical protein n=1 Tax=Dickeya fangzhongdai TaxID=1778540 RepID=UPI0026DEA8A3|nr:hypothetical protein [Dickeya fangzhongdai]WKV52150.1 hypothetical protein PL145_08030 [Dickeya fangzhongdai]